MRQDSQSRGRPDANSLLCPEFVGTFLDLATAAERQVGRYFERVFRDVVLVVIWRFVNTRVDLLNLAL